MTIRGNTMKHIERIAMALALVSSGCVLAETQSYNPSWYVLPGVSVVRPDSVFSDEDYGEGAALRLGKPISGRWEFQFGPTFSRSKDHGVRYDQFTAGADVLYMFSRDRFRPFLLFGAGAQRDDVLGRGLNIDKTSPYLNAGIGFQYAFSERWFTQVDLRRVHGFLRDDAFGVDNSDNDFLSVGIGYNFSVPARPIPVVASATRGTPPPEPVVQKPAPRFESYTLSALELFGFDRAELTGVHVKLDEIAAALAANPGIEDVVISGYTDRLGSEQYNQALSLRRADAVKAYLVGKGIASRRMQAQGNGEANPVVECQDAERAALIRCLEPNRRVEIERITVQRRLD